MEIKAQGAMPLWLTEALSELKIYPVSFSKYGMAAKTYLDYGKKSIELNFGNEKQNTINRRLKEDTVYVR